MNFKAGFLVAILFPSVFVFSQPGTNVSNIPGRFLPFFSFILIMWVLDHGFLDFSTREQNKRRATKSVNAGKILILSFIACCIYVSAAFISGQDRIMLASLYENDFSASAWFFSALRIVLFNGAMIFSKYLTDINREKQQIVRENEALRLEHLNAKHESLKQQVDPHFLFNSLNTLQSLIKQQSGDTLRFVAELSSVYRYMLSRRDNRFVSLRDELEFLRAYLYLLKIRFGDAIESKIAVASNLQSCLIPPHTLQLLAENAVKHNRFSSARPLLLTISAADNWLVVSNNLSPHVSKKAGEGIGLTNIRNRYQLLFGEAIRVEIKNDLFTVRLPLMDPALYSVQDHYEPDQVMFEAERYENIVDRR